ncbi:MAG: UDP-N-acetylglucosamine--N-acetylmuramyl-(pentapeptide) pyrophosphoryl-undecaprenol N-acetylglucosamine transferase [bacterium]
MTVLYSGGGTLGSVSPLLAVHEEMKKRADYHGAWIGLDLPKERVFVSGRGFEEFQITSPRLRNFEAQGIGFTQLTFPFRFVKSFFQSLAIISKTKPDVHFSAGSFVSIPVALACFVMRVPNVVHQQDLLPGLANRVMAKFANKVTVAFPVLAPKFGSRAVVTGNPVRLEVLNGDAHAARARYGFSAGKPVVLVIGGSSGAIGLNDMIRGVLPEILKLANVVHMTGNEEEKREGYVAVKFLGPEIKDIYALADVVVARASLSTPTELGILKKPMILVPIPGSHQEKNSEYFSSVRAALSTSQDSPTDLVTIVKDLLSDVEKRNELGNQAAKIFPVDAAARIADELSK